MNNPTAAEIESFCDNLKKSLLEASAKGEYICLGRKVFWKDIFTRESGLCPVDAVYEGMRLTVEIGRPAVERTLEEQKTR